MFKGVIFRDIHPISSTAHIYISWAFHGLQKIAHMLLILYSLNMRFILFTVDPENLVLRGVPFLFSRGIPIRKHSLNLVYCPYVCNDRRVFTCNQLSLIARCAFRLFPSSFPLSSHLLSLQSSFPSISTRLVDAGGQLRGGFGWFF